MGGLNKFPTYSLQRMLIREMMQPRSYFKNALAWENTNSVLLDDVHFCILDSRFPGLRLHLKWESPNDEYLLSLNVSRLYSKHFTVSESQFK